MVSIVIPVYNVAEYLPRCLDSLSKQDYVGEMEIILVDDGSTDSSSSFCMAFCNMHARAILIRQENKGLSEARNAGIKVANGEWIYFLDADDWLAPKALSTLFSFAQANSCDMVIGSFYYAFDDYLLYDDRWYDNQDPFVLSREEAMHELILQHFFKNFAWGKLYRTAAVKKHPFKPGVFFEDSYWQHLIVNEMHLIGVIPAPLYYYRQRKNSISGSFSLKNLDLLKGTRERLIFIKKNYISLYPLAAKRFTSLVQSCLECATDDADDQTKVAFLSFAKSQNISKRNKFLGFCASLYQFIFSKRPKRIAQQKWTQ